MLNSPFRTEYQHYIDEWETRTGKKVGEPMILFADIMRLIALNQSSNITNGLLSHPVDAMKQLREDALSYLSTQFTTEGKPYPENQLESILSSFLNGNMLNVVNPNSIAGLMFNESQPGGEIET